MNKRGGILLSVLVVMFLFSFLVLQLLFTYHQTADFSKRTIQLYQAKIAKEEFLIEHDPLKESQGTWLFDKGELYFEKKPKNMVRLRVTINGKNYYFDEALKPEPASSSTKASAEASSNDQP
ncbi:hypothetical protein JZO70_18625 [Enterococcus sp. 669A]|uniref:Late competence protein ComGG n=1 Tax=Candidatus Enterococcus moelleringii TaxID=2815325 RepID=A0ABS3LEY6_9ENTE|nr:competence type IV pilus minor pilin ComGG [Enterococcus sp. 669A]MBO1308198.1 hypothetical protein [Enterococcus sp. 669A]